MQFLSQVLAKSLLVFVLVGVMGFLAPQSLFAQGTPASGTNAAAPAQQPAIVTNPGLDSILGTGPQGSGASGLIFANICQGPRPPEGKGDTCACRASGDCSLDDVMQVFVNITILILGISGSIILLMFVYGGFLWITAHGDQKRIENGKETITNAVIGFAIILLAYSMVNFAIALLAGDTPGATLEDTLDNAGDGTAQ